MGDSAIVHEFGCCNRYAPAFKDQKADGIVGLSPKANTLLQSFVVHHKLDKNEFALCLGQSGGEMTVGGVDTALHRGTVRWTPYEGTTGYYVRATEVLVAGVATSANNHKILVDSGTTFTFIPSSIHGRIKKSFIEHCDSNPGRCLSKGSRNPRSAQAQDIEESIACYEFGSSPAERKRLMATFPPISIGIVAGDDGPRKFRMCVPPEVYFFESTATAHCIGMFRDSQFVLGANVMAFWNIIFNLDNGKIGWVNALCDRDDSVLQGSFMCGNESKFNEEEVLAPEFLGSWWMAALVVVVMGVFALVCVCIVVSHCRKLDSGPTTSSVADQKYEVVVEEDEEEEDANEDVVGIEMVG